MKKAFRLLALVLSLAFVIAAFAGCSDEGTSGGANVDDGTSDFKMACIMPLTGNAAQSGLAAQRALDLCIKEFNESGGLNGRKIVMDYYDDNNLQNESVNCAQLVIEDPDYLCVFGPFNSSCALAVAPMFEEAGICHLAPTGVEELTADYDNTIRLSLTQPARLKWSAEYAYNIHGFRTGVLLYQKDDNGVALSEMFPGYFEELGGQILASESFVAGTQDFNAILTALKEKNPDFIHLSGTYAEIASIMTQMADLGWNIPVYATGSAMDNTLISLCGDVADRILIAAPVNFEDQSPEFLAFLDKWAAEYDGEIPSNTMAVNFYEGALSVVQAIRAGATTRDKLIEWLRNTPEQVIGLTGDYNIVNGDPERTMYMMTVRDGKFTTWEEGMGFGIEE